MATICGFVKSRACGAYGNNLWVCEVPSLWSLWQQSVGLRGLELVATICGFARPRACGNNQRRMLEIVTDNLEFVEELNIAM